MIHPTPKGTSAHREHSLHTQRTFQGYLRVMQPSKDQGSRVSVNIAVRQKGTMITNQEVALNQEDRFVKFIERMYWENV